MKQSSAEKLYRGIGEIRPEIIEEAERSIKPKGRMILLKRLGTAAACLAVTAAMLFTVNAAFPAFAEELPLIGGIFHQINNYGGRNLGAANVRRTGDTVQKLAQPVTGSTQEVPAVNPGEMPLTVSVKEAHFDGWFLYAGLELDTEQDTYFLADVSECGVTINGETDLPGLATDVTNYAWRKVESGKYVKQDIFLLPEKYRDEDHLEVTLSYGGLNSSENERVSSSAFSLAFQVERTEVAARSIRENALEIDGIKLESATALPTGSVFVLTFPADCENAAGGVRREDGSRLWNGVMAAAPEKTEDGRTRVIFASGSISEDDTRKVVVTAYRERNSRTPDAVFLVDFQTGAVTQGSNADVVILPDLHYASGREAVKALSSGYLVTYFSYSGGGESAKMMVATPNEEYQELRVELWQGEQRLVTFYSTEDNGGALGFFPHYFYRDTEPEDLETDLHVYNLAVSGLALDQTRDMTVKLYDSSSEELLHQEDLSLTDQPVM